MAMNLELEASKLFNKEIEKLLTEEQLQVLKEKEEELKRVRFEVLDVLNYIPYDKQVDILVKIAKELGLNAKKGIPNNINDASVRFLREDEAVDKIIINDNDIISFFITPPPVKEGTIYLVSYEEFYGLVDSLNLQETEIEEISFEKILVEAIKKRTSDIHIKPSKDYYYVFFREMKDYVLQTNFTMTIPQGRALVSSLKNYAHEFTKGSFQADISSKVQDARAEYPNLNVSVRLAFMPMPNLEDEYVVARILKKQAISGKGLEELGYLEEDIEVFNDVLKRKGGLAVVSGITNSGKSTFVSHLLATIKDKNIITVENPVEYLIDNPNVSQHQVFETDVEELKSTFIDYAKGIKRSDGDIIFLGEWRNDKELSEIMEELSLAGQLIFTTLHINSAFVYFDSVESMYNVKRKTLIETLIISLNQALVKRVCPHCHIKMKGEDAINKLIEDKVFTRYSLQNLPFYNTEEILDEIKKMEVPLMNHNGCQHCNFKGFIGLTPIYEYFYPNVSFKEWIAKTSPTPIEIEKKSIEDGIGKNKLMIFKEKLLKEEVSLEEIINLR